MRRIAPLLATASLLALPATALGAEEGGGADRTTEIMIGLIIVLMLGMVLIGIIEQRRSH